jgi:hypothetical protein
MARKERFYIRFVNAILKCLQNLRIRRFWNRFSKKTFTVCQHLVLQALLTLESKSYRRFIEWLEVADGLVKVLGLPCIPHFTTLQKTRKRIRSTVLEKIVGGFTLLTRTLRVRGGVDSTGFSPTHASTYYTRVLSRDRKYRRKIRKHIKATFVCDLDSQLIMADKIRRGPANDNRDFKRPVQRAARLKPFKSFDADKGYDAEVNHALVVEELGAEDRMRLKNKDLPISRTYGRYRKKAKRRIHRLRRNHRAKCETVNSVIKRLMGATVRASTVAMQNKEIKWKEIAYNAYRLAKLLQALIGFLLGRLTKSFLKPRLARRRHGQLQARHRPPERPVRPEGGPGAPGQGPARQAARAGRQRRRPRLPGL